MVETLLSTPLVQQILLPFLLIFAVTFAVLQKTKILGEGKKQIDALVAMVIGLIVVGFGFATNLIVTLIPFLAISIVVILVFMILYGMAFSGKSGDEFKIPKGVKITIGILAAIGLLIVLAVATGTWTYVKDLYLTGDAGSSWLANGIFLLIIVGAVLLAVLGGKDSSSSSSEKKS